MEITESLTWDEYYINMLPSIAKKSKDRHTKMGAIAVGEDNNILSTGYNSFPRGINDNVPERLERPLKYDYIQHAERNLVDNAALSGIKLKGCVLYISAIPCNDCVNSVINIKPKRVIYDLDNFHSLLMKTNTKLTVFDKRLVKPSNWKSLGYITSNNWEQSYKFLFSDKTPDWVLKLPIALQKLKEAKIILESFEKK